MRKACITALAAMEYGFRCLEGQIPGPVEVIVHGEPALRYTEKTIEQAIIQKLARLLSGLNAIDVLLLNGFVQEQGVIQRTLDEIGEDIMFLALAITTGTVTPLHERYLASFWQEEFEEGVAVIENKQRRDQIRRRKIRNAIDQAAGQPVDDRGSGAGAVLSQTYSGFVHAASPFIMEMCDGDDHRFFTSGLRGTFRMVDHSRDATNYFYRGLISVTVAAKAFGDAGLASEMYTHIATFENAMGTKFMSEARAN